ncbi:MAG TPA: Maf family protein [Stellaceae bacterium]|nr:Maf family protein [Stellaceae bacterium]
MAAMAERLILASASEGRAALLRATGLDFTIEPAAIDERPVKDATRQAGDSAISCAIALASAKACCISRRNRAALVIGADQLLAAGSEWFDKPANLVEARAQLASLRGRTHRLATAICVAQAGRPVWQAASEPETTMRLFSDAFLDAYIAAEGEQLCGSVGAYRLEGRGVQLFSRISGDQFAVIGLPLVELLEFLRERGALLG